MPIQVTCPGCKATFSVSDKFAGKQGPCPKCKAPITIPKPAAAPATAAAGKGAPAATAPTAAKPAPGKSVAATAVPAAASKPAGPPPEVKIHGPEEAPASGKTKTGHPTAKPLLRSDARVTPKLLLLVLGTTAALFVAAYFARSLVAAPTRSTGTAAVLMVYLLRGVGLILIGWPVVLAGYAVLRDDELEPYRGQSLRIRTLFCLVGYLCAWGIYAAFPDDLKRQAYVWLLLAPAVIVPAALAAYFTLELDLLGSTIHACFFLLVTMMLGWTADLQMPWQPPREPAIAPPPAGVKLQVEYQRP